MNTVSIKSFYFFLALAFFSAPVIASNIPYMIPYSGKVLVDGENYEGKGLFKFAIVSKACVIASDTESCTTYWSNDGTSQNGSAPAQSIELNVNGGHFQVKLGNTAYTNMKMINPETFGASETYLRVWFDDGSRGFQQLDNDRQLISVPYAYHALKAQEVEQLHVKSENIEDASIGGKQINPAEVQARITQSCQKGESIRVINEDGSVECEIDNGNDYEAGNGIEIKEGKINILSKSISVDMLDYDPVTQSELNSALTTGDGLVIQDGAIQIKPQSISEDKLSFGVATQAELDGVKQELATSLSTTKVTLDGKIDTTQSALEQKITETQQFSVPLGGVIDWWRPEGSTDRVPDGYVICDGRTIDDQRSPFVGKRSPNLVNRFVMGVDVGFIGQTGGSATHNHVTDIDHTHGNIVSANAGKHSHTTDLAHGHTASSAMGGLHGHNVSLNHTHTVTINEAGAHSHIALKWNNTDKQWYDGAGIKHTAWDNGEDTAGSGFYSLGNNSGDSTQILRTSVEPAHDHTALVSTAIGTTTAFNNGEHNHAIYVAPLPKSLKPSSIDGEHAHNVNIGPLGSTLKTSEDSSSLPPYVGLLKIMRIY